MCDKCGYRAATKDELSEHIKTNATENHSFVTSATILQHRKPLWMTTSKMTERNLNVLMYGVCVEVI